MLPDMGLVICRHVRSKPRTKGRFGLIWRALRFLVRKGILQRTQQTTCLSCGYAFFKADQHSPNCGAESWAAAFGEASFYCQLSGLDNP